MGVVKVIEIISESSESWEAATRMAVEEAAKTVDGIQNVNIKQFKAIVEDGKIVKYRISAKISFLVEIDR